MKKVLLVMTVLLAVVLSPISFSGSQTSSLLSSLYLVVMEGQTITVSAGESKKGYTYQWMIGSELCDETTAANFGVEFSGGTTPTLTISKINKSLNNKTLVCYSTIYNNRMSICHKTIQVQEYKPVAPTISTIQSVVVSKNEECKLTVSASASDGGILSYQWYEASAENTREITPIDGAVASTYMCDTSKGGTRYYECKVINTKNGKTESVFSNIATVTVKTPIPTPEYNVKKASVNPGETLELKVTLSLSDSERGKITYQWYESAKNNPDEAKAMSGATSETYTVSGNAHSGTTRYYFCKITNELNGEKFTNMDDSMAMVEITFTGQHVHEYGEWKVKAEPTCTENGSKTRICECGEKQTEPVAALGHTYGEWAVKTAATESTEGQEERSCTKCGSIETRVIPISAVQSIANTTGNSVNQTTGVQNRTPWWLFAAIGGGVVGIILVIIILKKKNKV